MICALVLKLAGKLVAEYGLKYSININGVCKHEYCAVIQDTIKAEKRLLI